MTLKQTCLPHLTLVRNSFRNSFGLFLPSCSSSEGKDSGCPHSNGEGKASIFQIPSGEGKDSLCTVPSGDGKDSWCTVPSGREKDFLCIVSGNNQHKNRPASRGQAQAFSYPVGRTRGPPVLTQSTHGWLQTAF